MSLALPLFLGVLTWTLLEYVIHRFLGHRHRRNPFAKEHIRHHSQGSYFAPASKKVLAALATTAIAIGPAILIAGVAGGTAYTAGLVAMYVAYEVLHRREHTHEGIGPYGRWARRHHFFHHFVDPSKNHGVTSPLWDVLFGTYAKPGTIAVPEKLKMVWLTDERGEVHESLTAHYSLRRRRQRA